MAPKLIEYLGRKRVSRWRRRGCYTQDNRPVVNRYPIRWGTPEGNVATVDREREFDSPGGAYGNRWFPNEEEGIITSLTYLPFF